MVLLSIFFTRIRSHGGIISELFFIHFVALYACSSSGEFHKYCFKSFCMRFMRSTLHTSVGCISLQNASRTALCYATNTISENIVLIFDINHQQNTRRSDQIETIKTIMQTTRPRITWKVLPMAQVMPFLKKYSIKCEKI